MILTNISILKSFLFHTLRQFTFLSRRFHCVIGEWILTVAYLLRLAADTVRQTAEILSIQINTLMPFFFKKIVLPQPRQECYLYTGGLHKEKLRENTRYRED